MDDEDLDFESLLDAALGIQPAASADNKSSAPGAPLQGASSVVSYDQLSPSASPAASPVHFATYYPSPCSPCLSSNSMQMHASLHDSSTAVEHDPAALYSPVRESGSPPPDQHSPARPSPPAQRHQQAMQHTAAPPIAFTPARGDSSAHQNAAAAAAGGQHTSSSGNCPAHSSSVAGGNSVSSNRAGVSREQRDFTTLPREVQMRVLCFLSADALTTLAQTCSQLRGLCSEPVLWRRLFCHRWGKKGRQQNQLSWKARYMERDLTDMRAATGGGAAGGAADAMQDMFVQAHIARRQQALPKAAVDDLALVEDDEVAAKVLAWRKSRGFDKGLGAGPEAQPQRPRDLAQHVPLGGSGHRAGPAMNMRCGASGIAPRQQQQQQQQQRQPGVVRRRVAAGDGSSAAAVAEAATNSCRGAAAPAGVSARAAAADGAVGASGGNCCSQVAGSGGVAGDGSGRSSSWKPGVSAGSQAGGGSSSRGGAGSSSGTAAGGDGGAAAGAAKRPRQRRRWTQIGNVFCDEMTGWVHVCDETCSEKIIEPSSGLLVCPISGQVSDRMMTCAEEAAEEGGRCDEEGGKGQQEEDEGGERGRLARAFAAGYYCSNERELMRKCGVRLSR